jgi:hypothetical protein
MTQFRGIRRRRVQFFRRDSSPNFAKTGLERSDSLIRDADRLMAEELRREHKK